MNNTEINKIDEQLTKEEKIEHDGLYGISTAKFHALKILVSPLFKPFAKKIDRTVNEYYDITPDKNSQVFKKIIAEMEERDTDTLPSAAASLGYTRKAFYMLILKFVIILYSFDTYYAERGDYFLKRMIEERKKLYFDEQSNPVNWFPNEKSEIRKKYIMNR